MRAVIVSEYGATPRMAEVPAPEAGVSGRIVAPPITRIPLAEAPAAFAQNGAAPAGKTVIVP